MEIYDPGMQRGVAASRSGKQNKSCDNTAHGDWQLRQQYNSGTPLRNYTIASIIELGSTPWYHTTIVHIRLSAIYARCERAKKSPEFQTMYALQLLFSPSPSLKQRYQKVASFKSTGSVHALAISIDGQVLAAGGTEGVKLWNLETRKELTSVTHLESRGITLLSMQKII
ncbi:hypothetical protein M404DRAFT_35475 [Pisolithus tinctorius Marx 270]|uniref:Anaphase-promoting complex subunit 4 WD40 domain-containing protein n=1 Tax=Pisolithus tinctorius Marx 270 TaxID=870435 RepID=A0A0C3J8K8_PISTI|nr:hypothetical protein M404DRAFT_35475 [Pisolithus tinctorius Marx 270]